MALSMLTACGSNETTTTTESVSATQNSSVVSYVQSKMTEDSVGKNQAAVTLSGNESTHEAKALAALKGCDYDPKLITADDGQYADSTAAVTEATLLAKIGAAEGDGKTDVLFVAKGSKSDTDLGKAIVEVLKARKGNANDYVITSMSVFDLTITEYFAGTANLNGTSMTESTEYWVVVTTGATKSTSSLTVA